MTVILVLLIFVAIPLAPIAWMMSVREVPKKIVCPGCKTTNMPVPSACANCRSPRTRLVKAKDRKGNAHISTLCKACDGRTAFDPYCARCEANLTMPMYKGRGTFRVASLFEKF